MKIEDYALIGDLRTSAPVGGNDVSRRRLVGNFPQAFTHLTLVQAAKTLGNPTADVAARYVDQEPVHGSHR